MRVSIKNFGYHALRKLYWFKGKIINSIKRTPSTENSEYFELMNKDEIE